MTTAPVAKTSAYRGIRVDLKSIRSAIEDWIKRVRANRDNAKLEDWNMSHRAMLESRNSSEWYPRQ